MNPTRIFEILDVQLKNNPIENCMSEKKDGRWLIYNSRDIRTINQITTALLKLGVSLMKKSH